MTLYLRRCDVITSHRRQYNVKCLLGDHFALKFKEFIIVVFFKLQVSGVDRIANSEAYMMLFNDSSLIRICTVCIYKHSHISHRLPRDNQRDREQKTLLKSISSHVVNTCLGTPCHGSVASCSQTGIYTLFPPIYFDCVCCCQSRWLSWRIWCVYVKIIRISTILFHNI